MRTLQTLCCVALLALGIAGCAPIIPKPKIIVVPGPAKPAEPKHQHHPWGA